MEEEKGDGKTLAWSASGACITSSIFMHAGSQSCPKRMTTTRLSSPRMACKPRREGASYREVRICVAQEMPGPRPIRTSSAEANTTLGIGIVFPGTSLEEKEMDIAQGSKLFCHKRT
jgi:hypothetical protein